MQPLQLDCLSKAFICRVVSCFLCLVVKAIADLVGCTLEVRCRMQPLQLECVFKGLYAHGVRGSWGLCLVSCVLWLNVAHAANLIWCDCLSWQGKS